MRLSERKGAKTREEAEKTHQSAKGTYARETHEPGRLAGGAGYIRDHVNRAYNTQFVPCRVIEDDIRCHTDGFNGECVLEIKSTSDIHSSIDGYKVYLVQLVKYMEMCQVPSSSLIVWAVRLS